MVALTVPLIGLQLAIVSIVSVVGLPIRDPRLVQMVAYVGDACSIQCHNTSTQFVEAVWVHTSPGTTKQTERCINDVCMDGYSERFSVLKGKQFQLTIINVELDDSGIYTCIAMDEYQEYRFNTRLTITVGQIVALPGEEVMMSCHSSTNTPVLWTRTTRNSAYEVVIFLGTEVINEFASKFVAQRTGDMDHSLTLLIATVEDSGNYTCIEDEGFSDQWHTTELIVKDPELVQMLAYVGDKCSIPCHNTTTKIIDADWVRVSSGTAIETELCLDGVCVDEYSGRFSVSTGKQFRLTIANVELGDSGTYTCIAMDEYQEYRFNTRLTITERPALLSVYDTSKVNSDRAMSHNSAVSRQQLESHLDTPPLLGRSTELTFPSILCSYVSTLLAGADATVWIVVFIQSIREKSKQTEFWRIEMLIPPVCCCVNFAYCVVAPIYAGDSWRCILTVTLLAMSCLAMLGELILLFARSTLITNRANNGDSTSR